MQLRITNLSPVQVPILVTRAGRWFADTLMPGIETGIVGDDVTNIRLGKQTPGTAPADPDSMRAKDNYIAGIAAMQGRSDATGVGAVTLLRVLFENFEGTLDVNDGAASVGTLAKGDSKVVEAEQFMLTVS